MLRNIRKPVLQVLRQMSTSPPAKCARMSSMKIGTHNGTFHCDEALTCFMLKQLPEYQDAEIVRTRDPAVLDTCDVVVDVGGVFDPSKHRYDHHQRTFTDTMNSLLPSKRFTTKLSSAGLVYVHFGEKVIGEILKKQKSNGDTAPDSAVLFDKVYENFVEEMDAIDNGIHQTDGKPRYAITTTLSARVSNLNPQWNEESSDADADRRFQIAMETTGAEFVERVRYYSTAWWPARTLVQQAINKRKEVDESGEVLCFESGGLPWKDHLFTLEQELGLDPTIKFVLYTDQSGKWRVQCVPLHPHSFENRLSLLEAWRGVRDAQLSEKSGIPGCIFVHAAGFIGGNETYEGALQMVRQTLNARN